VEECREADQSPLAAPSIPGNPMALFYYKVRPNYSLDPLLLPFHMLRMSTSVSQLDKRQLCI